MSGGGGDVEGRGVYLDLKGPRDGPPVLLGVLVEDVLEQIVTDPEFGDAALAKDLRVNRFDDELRRLAARCARESRRVFVFSPLRLATAAAGAPGLAAHVEDALQLALLWHGRCGRPGTARWTLAEFLADLGQAPPAHLAPRHTAGRLRHVRAQLRQHGGYGAITGTAKAKWTKLLQQNAADVRGVRDLVVAAARGLA